MIKKILKSAVILLSAGVIASPALAADWGVSGQVRVDWDIMKSIEEGGTRNDGKLDAGDGGGKTRNPAGVQVDKDDSWVSFDLVGENAKGSLLYYLDGRQEFVGSASASEGAWTATANLSIRNDLAQDSVQGNIRDGNEVESVKAGDQTVELKHDSSFSFKLGLTTPLDSFGQGKDYLLVGADGDAPHVTDYARKGADLGAMDNRSNVAEFGINVGEALKLGLVLEAADSKDQLGGQAFQSIDYGTYGADSEGASQAALIGNLGIKANLDLGALDIGFVLINAGEKSDPSTNATSDANDPEYVAAAGGIGLGVGLDLGIIKPYLNMWNPSASSKNTTGEDETVSSNLQIGVDLVLGEHSGVGLSIVNRTTTYGNTVTDGVKVEDETAVSTTELGYKTKLGAATFQAAFVSDSIKATPGGFKADGTTANDTSEVAVSWIKIRLQQSF